MTLSSPARARARLAVLGVKTIILIKFGTLRIKPFNYTVNRQSHGREGVAEEGGTVDA